MNNVQTMYPHGNSRTPMLSRLSPELITEPLRIARTCLAWIYIYSVFLCISCSLFMKKLGYQWSSMVFDGFWLFMETRWRNKNTRNLQSKNFRFSKNKTWKVCFQWPVQWFLAFSMRTWETNAIQVLSLNKTQEIHCKHTRKHHFHCFLNSETIWLQISVFLQRVSINHRRPSRTIENQVFSLTKKQEMHRKTLYM